MTDDAGLLFCGLLLALASLFVRRSRLFVVGAGQIHAGFQCLLDQIRRAALRALLRYRLTIRREVALRIARAAVEGGPESCLALGDIALAALRALHPFHQVLLDVFAL